MKVNDVEIKVVHGSILDQDVDIVVNAANTRMRGGGGIDGIIHQKSGRDMSLELALLTPNPVETGEPVVTRGYNLKQPYIIHVAGPIWSGGHNNESALLAKAYMNSLRKANELGVKSIAFCSISTGVYNFPLNEAAQIAWKVVLEHVVLEKNTIQKIIFAMFGEYEYQVFSETFKENFDSYKDGARKPNFVS